MLRQSAGYSLVELIVVISLLGLLASVVIPSSAPYQEQKLDFAITELTAALRLARNEAIRSGQTHAIKINKDSGRVTVGVPEIIGGEVTGFSSLAYNPIDKKVSDFNLNTLPQTSGVRINQADPPFSFQTVTGPRDTCLFDANGNPFLISTGRTYTLTSGSIVVQNGLASRTVAVSMLGRITTQ